MLSRKTVVDQIEITRNGIIGIRFGLLIMDGEQEINSRWHRTIIEPGVSVDAQMAAVNAHLTTMGEETCPETEKGRVHQVVNLIHTPTVIAAYRREHPNG